MNHLGRHGLAAGFLVALGVGSLASCGGRTSGDVQGPDASVDASTGGSGGTTASGGTGAITASGGTGAYGGSGGTPNPCAGVSCNAPAKCVSGTCSCPGSLTYCSDACVDTQNSKADCGKCHHPCPGGWSCVSGKCQAPGTCDQAYCPNSGFGNPCCVTPNGPCGTDTGYGCQSGGCNVAYCPSSGSGNPCCVSANGPCGIDYGSGCQAPGACNVAFCPITGFGNPCCVTPTGPCGMDTGSGCQSTLTDGGLGRADLPLPTWVRGVAAARTQYVDESWNGAAV